jgi:hypothetical protein
LSEPTLKHSVRDSSSTELADLEKIEEEDADE